MYKRILLAAKPSVESVKPAGAAFALAKAQGAELDIVCVRPRPPHGVGAMLGDPALEQAENLRTYAQRFFKDLEEAYPFKVTASVGLPQSEILRLAWKNKSDLVVMGAGSVEQVEDAGGARRYLANCLEQVCLGAGCPVMLISEEICAMSGTPERIVAATDFSEPAENCVRYAASLARESGAELHVLTVVPPGENGLSPAQRLDAAQQKLEQAYGGYRSGLPEITLRAWEGSPAEEILKYAKKVKADRIVMAHHSQADPEAPCGSTTGRVALGSICPTLSVPLRRKP